MANLSWGTKYRPKTLNELLATKQIKEALKNITQATLITGQTGSGKSTVSHLIAKLHKGELIDINAAADTGIDKIRELIETVKNYPLAQERYVVVIDEAHALSQQAVKALLKEVEKTSENGPLWLVLTDQPDKLPQQFRDRLNSIVMTYPPLEMLQELCDTVLEEEGLKNVPEDLIDACIEHAGNNPRLTLNTLQDAIGNDLHNKKATLEQYVDLLTKYDSSSSTSITDQLSMFLSDGIIPHNSIMAVYPTWIRLLTYAFYKRNAWPIETDNFGEFFWNKNKDNLTYSQIPSLMTELNAARASVVVDGANPESALALALWASRKK